MERRLLVSSSSAARPATSNADTTIGSYSAEFAVDIHPFGQMPVRAMLDDDGTILLVELITGSYGAGLTWPSAAQRLVDAVGRQYEFLARQGHGRLSAALSAQLVSLDRRRQAPSERVKLSATSATLAHTTAYAA
jgi:hypothetical protein